MEKIKNILVWNSKFVKDSMVDYSYGLNVNNLNCDKEVTFLLPASIEERLKDEKSFTIVEDNVTEYVNGFRLVKNGFGQYLYVSEEDNRPLPYVFDIATDFNEYGLAMVANNARVSWINKNFQYINNDGELCAYDNVMNDGYDGVYGFSDSPNPLSRLTFWRISTSSDYASYLDKNMKIKDFYKLGGDANEHPSKSFSRYAEDFDKDGFAFAEDRVLCDQGYYIKNEVIVKDAMNKGLVKSIFEKTNNKN